MPSMTPKRFIIDGIVKIIANTAVDLLLAKYLHDRPVETKKGKKRKKNRR